MSPKPPLPHSLTNLSITQLVPIDRPSHFKICSHRPVRKLFQELKSQITLLAKLNTKGNIY